MGRFSDAAIAPQDAYRAALVSLMHTPVRFLRGAIGEVADAFAVPRSLVEDDLRELCEPDDAAIDASRPAPASRRAQ